MHDTDWSELLKTARKICGKFSLFPEKDFSAGSVAAALLTRQGKIHTGICADLACGLGFCAEAAAAAEMLKHRETEIQAIVAINRHGIIPPCGRCREMLAQLNPGNLTTQVLVAENEVRLLRDLLPEHWIPVHLQQKRKGSGHHAQHEDKTQQ